METDSEVDLIMTTTHDEAQNDALVAHVKWVRARIDGDDAPRPVCELGATLKRKFGLDSLDMDILWAVVVGEVDPLIRSQVRRAYPESSLDGLDGATLVRILSTDVGQQLTLRRRLASDAPVFRHKLVRLYDDARSERRMSQAIRPAPTVLTALCGEASGEDPLGGIARWVDLRATLNDVVLPESILTPVVRLLKAHDTALLHLRDADPRTEGRGLVLFFTGAPGTGKTLLAEALANEIGKKLMLVRVDRLLEDPFRAPRRLADLFLEAQLHDAVVFFDECDPLVDGSVALRAEPLHELERFEGIVIMASNRGLNAESALQRRIAQITSFPTPDADARERIWALHLDRIQTAIVASDVSVKALGGRFELTGGYIRNAVNLALHRSVARQPVDPILTRDDLYESAMAQLRGDMGDLTKATSVRLTLKNLILEPAIEESVNEVLNACRQRDRFLYDLGMAEKLPTAKGIVILFSGDPGTGKTFCAEILAGELGRPLHRVHIPSVVSSYVGETEKNVSRLFELARAQDAILLFDEADSLFAGRTNVESSTDRFANMEVNQLLQEVERHDGIVILTTNLKTSLDNALARRILFRVEFPFPAAAERARIWQNLLPEGFEDGDDPVSVTRLASAFEIAGGNIKNVVVRACYRALHEGTQLSQQHLEAAGTKECEALGKIVRTR